MLRPHPEERAQPASRRMRRAHASRRGVWRPLPPPGAGARAGATREEAAPCFEMVASPPPQHEALKMRIAPLLILGVDEASLFPPPRSAGDRQNGALSEGVSGVRLTADFKRPLRELRHHADETIRRPGFERRFQQGLAAKMHRRVRALPCLCGAFSVF